MDGMVIECYVFVIYVIVCCVMCDCFVELNMGWFSIK